MHYLKFDVQGDMMHDGTREQRHDNFNPLMYNHERFHVQIQILLSLQRFCFYTTREQTHPPAAAYLPRRLLRQPDSGGATITRVPKHTLAWSRHRATTKAIN
jgi:hypothetical protein